MLVDRNGGRNILASLQLTTSSSTLYLLSTNEVTCAHAAVAAVCWGVWRARSVSRHWKLHHLRPLAVDTSTHSLGPPPAHVLHPFSQV